MNYFRRPAGQLLLIVAIGLLAYANTFQVPFLFDDKSSITENPVIRNLGAFLDGAGYLYNSRRFVGYLSVAMNYRLGGLEVVGYHIFNLSVHLFSACLVYALVRLTLRTPFFGGSGPASGAPEAECLTERHPEGASPLTPHDLVPLFAALLFVAHPVQTQAVTYIIQRLASLATMFYLLSLVLYVRARLCTVLAGPRLTASRLPVRVACFLGAFLSAALAMKTKEIAFTLPLVVLLYECFFFGMPTRKRVLGVLPILLTLLVIPLSLVQADRPIGQLLSDVAEKTRLQTDMPRPDYLYTQFRVIVTYLRLLIFPVKQNVDYDYPIQHSFFTAPVLLSFLLLVALLGLALYLFFRSRPVLRSEEGPTDIGQAPGAMPQARLVSFGILWFFLTLSVESSLIPIVDVIFEHRLYLPSVGVCIGAGVLFSSLIRKYPGNSSRTAVAACVLLLAATTWGRNTVWKDRLTLWTDVVSKSPGKARPHLNLGSELMRLGRMDEAVNEFKSAVRFKPDYAEAYYNLGVAFNKMDRPDEAIEQFGIALRLDPDDAEALNNLAISFGMKGLIDYAISYFEAALRLKPESAQFHYNLSMACQEKGLAQRAEEEYRLAFRLDPALLRQ